MTDTNEPLFKCACGGDVPGPQVGHSMLLCGGCGERWTPEARDGLARLRSLLTRSGLITTLNELTQLRESQRLADEWLTKQLEVDEYRRNTHPTDKATILGDLLVAAHQAKLAYQAHCKTMEKK